MMRPTIPIAALMVVTAVDNASTMSSVQSVNATLEILVSATIIWVKKFCQCQKPNYNYSLGVVFLNTYPSSVTVSTFRLIYHCQTRVLGCKIGYTG